MKRITLPLLFVLSALSPAAFASNMTDCWLGKVTDEKLLHFNCQHNSRINSNGHRVQDVSMHGSKNDLNYSLVLWTDPKAKTWKWSSSAKVSSHVCLLGTTVTTICAGMFMAMHFPCVIRQMLVGPAEALVPRYQCVSRHALTSIVQ